MNIGIIGAGNMGSALGKIWAANHSVLFSFSRDHQKLHSLAQEAGANAKAGSPEEAAKFGEVILIAVPWIKLEEAIAAAVSLEGKIIITCVSPNQPDFQGETTGIRTAAEISAAERIAQLAPGARVVEAFNLTFAEVLKSDTKFGSKPSLFYCGDDEEAKAVVAKLTEESGYEGIDAGALMVARSLEALATAWVQMAAVSSLFPDVALKVLKRQKVTKVLIVYTVSTGNTEKMAQAVADGAKSVAEVEGLLKDAAEATNDNARWCDAIILGSPMRHRTADARIKKFVKEVCEQLQLADEMLGKVGGMYIYRWQWLWQYGGWLQTSTTMKVRDFCE